MVDVVVDGAEGLGWTVVYDASNPDVAAHTRVRDVVAHLREVGEGPSMDHKVVLPLTSAIEIQQRSGGTTTYVWNRAFAVPLVMLVSVIQPAFGDERERLEQLVRSVLPRGQVEDASGLRGEQLVIRSTFHQPASKALGIFTTRDAESNAVWAMRLGQHDVVMGVNEIDPKRAHGAFADAERAVAAARLEG